MTLDLEQPCYQVSILWENAYAKGYKIQGSLDDHNYFDIHYETNGQGSLENIYFDNTCEICKNARNQKSNWLWIFYL
ncbi:MAG: hypothetical protein ACLRHW_12800 [Coprobacillus cateniformis]